MTTKRAGLLLIRVLTDLSAVTLGWILAYFLRFSPIFEAPKGVPDFGLYAKLTPFIVVIWGLAFAFGGFYRRSGTRRSAVLEALDILQCCALATVILVSFTFFYEEYRYSRITLLWFAIIHPIFVVSGRSLVRKFLRAYKKFQPKSNVLVIGSGERVYDALNMQMGLEFEECVVVGALLVGDAESVAQARKICETKKIPVIEKCPEDWTEFLTKSKISITIFCLDQSEFSFLDKHFENIAEQVPQVKLLPDLRRYARFGAGVEKVDEQIVIDVHRSPLDGTGALTKRMMDLLVSTLALVVLSPLMVVLAILVKITSRGPVFYKQERMGLDGRVFQCLKFRSMPVHAETSTGPVWAKAGESRSTAIGGFLRRYSLDELPQLFNVIRGQMSLVGPRPERPVFVDKFRRDVPGYMLRHRAKAGITGWAQVNGWRGNTSIEKRIECDLYYIQNWSVWLDIKILAMTVGEVFFSKNAY